MSMTLKKAITLAMDGKAVLFLGSGFSFGAKNCQNRTPWTGKALADHIADLCGFPGEPMPLEMAAQEYIRQKGDDALIELLHEEYDLSSVSSGKKFKNIISAKLSDNSFASFSISIL